MKTFSIKLILFFFFLVMAGLYSAALWANIAGGIGALVMIVLLHLDNLDFCRKMDRIMAGEKNVKL
jgi:hypothetical protein